jgi:hypothetical protein
MLPHCVILHLEELSRSPIELNDFMAVLNKYVMDTEQRDSWISYFKKKNRYLRATEGLRGSGLEAV